MSFNILASIICFVIFVIIMATPKIPNSLAFFLVAPLAVFTGVLKIGDVAGVMSNNILLLVIVIGIFSHLMTVSTLDMSIGVFVDKLTRGKDNKSNKDSSVVAVSKSQETLILAILYIVAALLSSVMQNVSVALAMLPTLYGISKVTGISRSKMVLFIIYATTLGGAITLIGTPTNMFANAALVEAGIQEFKFFDFAWVALPIATLGGIYLISFHHLAPSYDDINDDIGVELQVSKVDPAVLERQKRWTSISFIAFVVAMIMDGFFKDISTYINPYMVGFFTLSLMYFFKVYDFKEYLKGFPSDSLVFMWGILVVIRIVSNSGLGDAFGDIVTNLIGDSKNLYVITSILFIASAIVTQFMNNMAAAGALSPIGISIANSMGADPRAIVLAIAIGAGCSYLTPMASGTNQSLIPFTKLRFQDFAKYGWPLIVISFVCCVFILPLVFPFF